MKSLTEINCPSSHPLQALVAVAWVFAQPVLAAGLPDTGQTTCFTGSGTTSCTDDSSFPRQDGSAGSTGSHTKLDAAGNELDLAAANWSCVRDNITGLIWENKAADSSLHGVEHRYIWYNNVSNGGEPGGGDFADTCGDTFDGDACVTKNFVAIVNATNFCGANDWRLPTQAELLTLVHAGNQKPSIDTSFFPNTASVPYWSSTTYARIPGHAWGVHFGYGAAHAESKSVPNAVRLVRGTWVK